MIHAPTNGATKTLNTTARRAIDAYGGEALWRKAEKVSITFSASGAVFVMKLQTSFNNASAIIDVKQPFVRFGPIGKRKLNGVLDGTTVRLEQPSGGIVSSRVDARSFFPGGRRNIYWDDLDQTYFSGYALWNYFTLPALLMRPDISWTEVEPQVLEAKFPSSLPTHSTIQRFHFDGTTGLLKRHDYTAEVFGGWARASNVVSEHETSERGFTFTAKRRVIPRRADGKLLPLPVLVTIDVHSYSID